MIFDKIRLVGPSNAIDLPLRGAQPNDPYIVKDVDGLGPSEVVVNMKDTLTRGGIMQSLRPRNKNLDILVKINPDYTLGQRPDALRDEIYKMLAPVMGAAIKLQLVASNEVKAEIPGYLSRVTPNPFSKDPEVQISMPCTQPYFAAPQVVNVNTTAMFGGQPSFDWPIDVQGTAPTPFAMSVKFSQNNINPEIYHMGSEYGRKFYVPGSFSAGQSLAIGGYPGVRFARKDIPLQPSVDLMGSLGMNSEWLDLYGGVTNTLRFSAQVYIEWLYYTPKFQGI